MKSPKKPFLKLLKDNAATVAEEFGRLDIIEQAELFLHAGDKERLKIVEIADRPRALLEKIPATELWFTIKRLTPSSSLPLIKYSTPEQLQVVSDIEWWQKDRLDPDSIYEWLEYILACGMDRVVEWFNECDWNQIQWFFKQAVVVFKKDDKEIDPADVIEWPREDMPITYEGLYYFQVLDEKHSGLLNNYMEILVKHDQELYASLCEACIWEVPSEKEEEAYEVRNRRLSEHGFPSFDEAIAIYSPIRKEKFESIKKREVTEKIKLAPRYPLVVLGDGMLFVNRVLSVMNAEDADRLLLEAAHIANSVLIADGEGIEPEAMKSSLIKALGYVNIGLELLSDGDIEKAAAMIRDYWLVSIFQVGLDEVMRLSRETKEVFKKGWMAGKNESLGLLEPGQRALIENLLLKRPKYYTGGNELNEESFRDFLNGEELSLAKKRVLEIEFIGGMMERLFAVSKTKNFPEGLEFTGMLITLIINVVNDGDWILKPVSPKKLERFLKKMALFHGHSHIDKAIDELKKRIYAREAAFTGDENAFLDDFINNSKCRLIEELGDVTELPESRYVQCVWIS